MEKLVLDPVILNQNKSGVFHRIQNLCIKNHKLSIPSWNLYQVMEFDVLSGDLGW